MESKFGRFGPTMTRVLVGALVIAVLLWAWSMLRDELLIPILGIVKKGENLESLAAILLFGLGGGLSFMLWAWFYIRRSTEKRLQEIAAKRREVEGYILAHDSTHVFVITGEDAKAQWPEIRKRLDAWEQGEDA